MQNAEFKKCRMTELVIMVLSSCIFLCCDKGQEII